MHKKLIAFMIHTNAGVLLSPFLYLSLSKIIICIKPTQVQTKCLMFSVASDFTFQDLTTFKHMLLYTGRNCRWLQMLIVCGMRSVSPPFLLWINLGPVKESSNPKSKQNNKSTNKCFKQNRPFLLGLKAQLCLLHWPRTIFLASDCKWYLSPTNYA